jgi:hypothetical protein
MLTAKERAKQQFRTMVKWIALASFLMVAAALGYLGHQGSLSLHTAIATILGVSISVVLGCGLFALAFFSDKSGHDDMVTDATKTDDAGED